MLENMTELGVGGIFAVMVLKVVLDFMGKGQRKPPWVDEVNARLRVIEAELKKMGQRTRDLHVWHSPDSGGEQSWKGTQLLRVMKDLDEMIKSNIRVNEKLLRVIERQNA